ncbi:MAG TPA: response regulator, partial [Myxococcota bacterium]|nr:response regulator [Myxococcota bacterium]
PTDLLEVATGALAPAPRARAAEAARAHSGLTVLVAEDNPVNQAFIVKLLERRGVSMILANNGADALDRVQETPDDFDAILMDLQMPVMDGYEAAAVLRLREAQASSRRIPIIAITAHALDGERERCLEAGMDDYLSKPVDEAGLFAALDRVTRRKVQGDAPIAHQEAFDRARVLDFAAGDKSFLSNLVSLFADTSPRQLQAIREAIEARSGQALYRAAHQLKGSVSNFGAANAYALASQLEALGKADNLEAAGPILESLEAELAAVRAGLARLLTELG